jgi:SAM-dependent methyltransferase
MNQPHPTTYADTRRAWRDIWSGTAFARELATLAYPRAQKLLGLYLPYLDKAAPILEAGCGPGHIVHYLRERGYPALGIDYAPEAFLVGAEPEIRRELPLHVGDVHHLPYPADTFGAYLSFGVVEHFEHGPAAALAEAYRVLQPGGVLVLTTPTPNFVEALRKFKDRLLNNHKKRADYFETAYTGRQLAHHAIQAGFVVARTVPYSHSFTFYGLGGPFRAPGYYRTSRLAEFAGAWGKRLAPWATAFEALVIATKT